MRMPLVVASVVCLVSVWAGAVHAGPPAQAVASRLPAYAIGDVRSATLERWAGVLPPATSKQIADLLYREGSLGVFRPLYRDGTRVILEGVYRYGPGWGNAPIVLDAAQAETVFRLPVAGATTFTAPAEPKAWSMASDLIVAANQPDEQTLVAERVARRAASESRRAQSDEAQAPTLITVSAPGEVTARPDRASTTVGVRFTRDTAGAAQGETNRVMDAVIKAVKEAGAEDEQVQTVSISLSPQYTYRRDRDERELTGYQSYAAIRVTTDIDTIGPVIDAAIKAGANDMSGVSFELSNREELYQQALKRAMRIARQRAQALAEAIGRPLGDIVEVREGDTQGPRPMMRGVARMEMDAAASAPTPVEAGELTVTAHVEMTVRVLDDRRVR